MKNIRLFILSGILAVAAFAFAADNTGNASGVVRSLGLSRWQVTKVGKEASTGTTSNTNVVTTSSAVIGKIVFVPGALDDTMKIYNASHGSNATAAVEVFTTVANSPTLGNSPTTGLLAPIVYDLTPGWSCTSGITVIGTRTVTTTINKAFIGWDTIK